MDLRDRRSSVTARASVAPDLLSSRLVLRSKSSMGGGQIAAGSAGLGEAGARRRLGGGGKASSERLNAPPLLPLVEPYWEATPREERV